MVLKQGLVLGQLQSLVVNSKGRKTEPEARGKFVLYFQY